VAMQMGRTCLHLAVAFDHLDMVMFLITKGADFTLQSKVYRLAFVQMNALDGDVVCVGWPQCTGHGLSMQARRHRCLSVPPS
jgi:hypothetical protein